MSALKTNRKSIRTVELQLLRHGPPQNQLLSPLTNYLALCGDHPNTTLNFPLEHAGLKTRLRALRYEDSEETRRAQLNETSQIVAKVLAAVPGLISEFAMIYILSWTTKKHKKTLSRPLHSKLKTFP